MRNYKRVHFIGIGGISMSGLAEILHRRGCVVSGSDKNASSLTEHLSQIGVKVYVGHAYENLTDDVESVIYNAAIGSDNPELLAARDKGIKLLTRAELLGDLMEEYSLSAAISGTHGKTTCTSMLSEILLCAKKDPTLSLGGVLPSINSNLRMGQSDYFVAEACEYHDSFLSFRPRVGVILNIEEDHLDYFKDLAAIQASFHKFAENCKEGLVINKDIQNFDSVTAGLRCKLLTFGFQNADFSPTDIVYDENGNTAFTLLYKAKPMGRVQLQVKGKHNILNALAACAAGYLLGLSWEELLQGVSSFTGTKRRFEILGECRGFTIIDDYAHHPTEIKASLEAAKHIPHRKLWCVYQPHTFTRTKALMKEFSEAFYQADEVMLVDIYSAREPDLGEVHSRDLAKALNKNGVKATYFGSFAEAENFILENCFHKDLCITMGAGDINLIAESLLLR